jgi:type IV fimbrial biogenesis protein FimT
MLVRPNRPPRGFTLIESMVVIALVAIVGSIALPSFRSFIGTMNAKSAAFDLINDLTAARSEAIRLNWTVRVVPMTGTDWSTGWRIVRTANPDNWPEANLRERPALGSSLSVGSAPAQVEFRPNGRLADDTTTSLTPWSIASSISGVTPRCVVISPTGSARAKTGAC